MSFSLPALARRQRNIRRKVITLRQIAPPATMAGDLYRIYNRAVAAWEAAIPGIMLQYEQALSEMVTDDAQSVQSAVEEAESTIGRLLLTLTIPIRDWAMRIERWQRGKWVGAVRAGTGVDLAMMIGPEDARQTLEAAIQWNVSLIKDVSDQARQRISNAVWDGLRNRTAPREVAAKLREAVAMGRKRSERIAADQLSKLNNALADERRREAGLPVWEWVHSRKKHPRQDHVERDGKWYSDEAEYVGLEYEGKTIGKPPEDRPGQLPYCGCHSRSVLVFLE